MDESSFNVDLDNVTSIAKEWKIRELSLFGSVANGNLRNDSDIDVLVQFDPDVKYSLFDIAELKRRLEEIFHRPVDLLEKDALQNPFRKKMILKTAKVIYAA